jgi:GR25 family glycosyltransferase involved in LPS biosynthesis
MIFANPTVVIARSFQSERRRAFEKQADAIGMTGWRFFDAFDGERMHLSTNAPSAHGREGRAAPQPLKPTELGCLLSHLAVVRSALAFDLDELAVLEDDIQFADNFCEHWDSFLSDLPSDWLMVHGAGDHGGMSEEEMPQPVSLHVNRVVRSYGTRFMLMRREAMGMMADDAGCTEPADWLLPKLFETKRVYTPRKWLMRHR